MSPFAFLHDAKFKHSTNEAELSRTRWILAFDQHTLDSRA